MAYPLVLFLFVLLVSFVLRHVSSGQILRIRLWIIISFSFLLLTHFFSGFVYRVGSTLDILPYVFLCLFLLISGEGIGYNAKIKSLKPLGVVSVKLLSRVSLMGAVLVTFDYLRLNTIVIGMRIEDFKVSSIGVLGTIMCSGGIVVWLFSLCRFLIFKESIPIRAYLSLISYVIVGFLAGGRQAFLFLFLSSFILYVWSKKYSKENFIQKVKKRKAPIGLYVIILLVFAYFSTISAVRTQIFDIDNKIGLFESLGVSRLSDDSREVVRSLGPLSEMYLEGLFYYSHELPRLDILFDNYDYPPLLGLAQFQYISRRIEWLTGPVVDDYWKAVEYAVEVKTGFYSHTWGTFIASYIHDYGRIGTPIMCLITGLLAGFFSKNSLKSTFELSTIRQSLVCAAAIFSIQFSPFFDMLWFVSLMFITLFEIKNE